ncbi:MAG TPA: BON domain-containing protein [Pirellulales bacterium]|nr:BON domain-containing protein [Pirellulales bacterium]
MLSDNGSTRCEPQQAEIAESVAARFRRSGYPFLRGVCCSLNRGIVILTGRVPTFHLKQLAQALAAHTPGVYQVENRLHVTNRDHRASTQQRAHDQQLAAS